MGFQNGEKIPTAIKTCKNTKTKKNIALVDMFTIYYYWNDNYTVCVNRNMRLRPMHGCAYEPNKQYTSF